MGAVFELPAATAAQCKSFVAVAHKSLLTLADAAAAAELDAITLAWHVPMTDLPASPLPPAHTDNTLNNDLADELSRVPSNNN